MLARASSEICDNKLFFICLKCLSQVNCHVVRGVAMSTFIYIIYFYLTQSVRKSWEWKSKVLKVAKVDVRCPVYVDKSHSSLDLCEQFGFLLCAWLDDDDEMLQARISISTFKGSTYSNFSHISLYKHRCSLHCWCVVWDMHKNSSVFRYFKTQDSHLIHIFAILTLSYKINSFHLFISQINFQSQFSTKVVLQIAGKITIVLLDLCKDHSMWNISTSSSFDNWSEYWKQFK